MQLSLPLRCERLGVVALCSFSSLALLAVLLSPAVAHGPRAVLTSSQSADLLDLQILLFPLPAVVTVVLVLIGCIEQLRLQGQLYHPSDHIRPLLC